MLKFIAIALIILASSLMLATLLIFLWLALTEGKNKK